MENICLLYNRKALVKIVLKTTGAQTVAQQAQAAPAFQWQSSVDSSHGSAGSSVQPTLPVPHGLVSTSPRAGVLPSQQLSTMEARAGPVIASRGPEDVEMMSSDSSSSSSSEDN